MRSRHVAGAGGEGTGLDSLRLPCASHRCVCAFGCSEGLRDVVYLEHPLPALCWGIGVPCHPRDWSLMSPASPTMGFGIPCHLCPTALTSLASLVLGHRIPCHPHDGHQRTLPAPVLASHHKPRAGVSMSPVVATLGSQCSHHPMTRLQHPPAIPVPLSLVPPTPGHHSPLPPLCPQVGP